MKRLARLYDGLIVALASLAGAMLAVVFLPIINDVVLRNLRISPPAWTTPVIEMGLLYITMLAAPWLVRTRGHVVVEVLREAVGPAWRRRLEVATYVICIAISAVLTWFAAGLWIEAYQSGAEDFRAINIPRTVIYAPMVVGFFLVGCEFVRYLVTSESFYHARASNTEGV